MSKMDRDTFTYIRDAIEECDDLMSVRAINKAAYERSLLLEKIRKSTFKVGDPCIVDGKGELTMYARITKINPKLVEVEITESDHNPVEYRGLKAKVNPFQVTVLEQI
mgnify:CR=1 FL=1|tara:strand:- start:193 stop:516 length:324 start_codon:yes stop_codon:yes gene_type:complete